MDMVRFSRSDDPGFQSIAGELQRWIQEQDPKTGKESLIFQLRMREEFNAFHSSHVIVPSGREVFNIAKFHVESHTDI